MFITALLIWIVAGAAAGLIARAVFPGQDPGGFVITAVIGACGALIGGFIADFLDLGGADASIGSKGFLVRIAAALGGAVFLLLVYRIIAGRRA